MRKTWRRRATAGAVGLALGLILVVPIAAAPLSTGKPEVGERQTAERSACYDMGRAERGSREFPTPGTPMSTSLGQGDNTLGPGTESGGAYVPGFGTVSHASIDNNFDRLTDQARTSTGTGDGS